MLDVKECVIIKGTFGTSNEEILVILHEAVSQITFNNQYAFNNQLSIFSNQYAGWHWSSRQRATEVEGDRGRDGGSV